jgi:hypothetical protein
MDLRGFQAHNAGCRYELTTLAQASRELRVVALTDSQTDRAAAQEAIASGRQERFTWLEASHFNSSKHREVLASYLPEGSLAAHLSWSCRHGVTLPKHLRTAGLRRQKRPSFSILRTALSSTKSSALSRRIFSLLAPSRRITLRTPSTLG